MTAKTALSFTVNIHDVAIYDWLGVSNKITNCLRKRCSELSIKSINKSKHIYMPDGWGAVCGDFGPIYNFIVMVYHNLGPIYKWLINNQWLLEIIKNIILFMPSIRNRMFQWRYKQRQSKSNYISVPVMDVNIRCDVDSGPYANNHEGFNRIQHAMIEIINVVDEFDISIKKCNPEFKIIYNITAKSIESSPGISVTNMLNINKLKDQKIDIINKQKDNIYDFSINVDKTRILYNYKPRLIKGIHIW